MDGRQTLTDPLEGTLETAFPTRSLAAKALGRQWVSEEAVEGAGFTRTAERQICEILEQAHPRAEAQGSKEPCSYC